MGQNSSITQFITPLHILIAVGGSIILFGIIALHKFIKEHGMFALIWRHFSGHAYDGKFRTDAGWFIRARNVNHRTGRVIRWHHYPRMTRAGIRTGSTIILVSLAYGLVKDPFAVILSTILLCVTAIGISTFFAIHKARVAYAKRGTAAPMALAMAPILDIPEKDAIRAIEFKPDWMIRKQGEIGRITLPVRFRANPAEKEAVGHLVATRMPVDIDIRWHTSVTPQYVAIMASPRPPSAVPFGQFMEFMHELPLGQVMLGLDKMGEPYTGMLGNRSDNPHWGLSVQTGRGKSTMLVATGAQILHQDPESKILGIDPKMSSLDALEEIPGVTLACDPMNIEFMWACIDRYHADMMERLRIVKRDKTAEFPVDLCMLDEANTAAQMWKGYWSTIKSASQPATPPIWRAIAEITWMGRAVRKNLIIVGQRLDAPATGGQGMRDSLGLIGLGGVRANQYKMLVDPSGSAPRFPKIKGRWLYYDSNETTWVQNLLPDNLDQLRKYAMEGRQVAKVDIPRQNAPAVIPGKVVA